MSLITDKVFYQALLSNQSLVDQVGGRIESTSIPVPDEELLNEPVPFIIITYDGMQNDGFTKDNSYEGDTDHVQISIEVTAENREQLGDLMQAVPDRTPNGSFNGTTKKSVILSGGRSPKSKDLRTIHLHRMPSVRRSFDSLRKSEIFFGRSG